LASERRGPSAAHERLALQAPNFGGCGTLTDHAGASAFGTVQPSLNSEPCRKTLIGQHMAQSLDILYGLDMRVFDIYPHGNKRPASSKHEQDIGCSQ
jgi:hypothetical protein